MRATLQPPSKQVSTGDTLCDEKPVVPESMDFPEPVISLAIELKTKGDQEKLGQARQADGRRPGHSASRPTTPDRL